MKWTVGLLLALLIGLALFIIFASNSLRGPISRAVTEATGRELRIEGDFRPVWSWVHPRFRAEKITLANPDWAAEDHLFAPKDSSIASLNSPLYVRGTFGDPKVSPDVGKLAAKGVGAIVMGVVNPLLAVLPLLKEGRREDSDYARLIAQASAGATKPRRPASK